MWENEQPSLGRVVKEGCWAGGGAGPHRGVEKHLGEKDEVWGVVYLRWGPSGRIGEGGREFQEGGV